MKHWVRIALSVILSLVIVASIGFSQGHMTITVQDYFQPGSGALKALTEIFNKFEQLHPNVVINHVYVPRSSIMQKILEEKLSGTLPDIIMADNPWVPSLMQAKVWMNIKPFVKNWDYYKTMFKPYKNLVTYNNGVYALQLGTNNILLFYNGKLLKEAGISKLPTTWSELLKVCAQLKEKLGPSGIYPIAFSAAPEEECTWQFEPFLWSNGGNLLDLSNSKAIEALQFWRTLVQKEYAPREVVNWGQGDVGTMFANGKLAMMINGCWEFHWHVLPNVRKKYDVGVIKMPVPQEGLNPVVPFGGEVYGIAFNESSDKLPIVLDLLKFIYSPNNIAKFDMNTSYIPVAKSAVPVLEKELGAMKGLFEPFIEQSKYAVARTIAGGGALYPRVSSVVWTAIQEALIGSKTPTQAFKEAATRIRKLFHTQEAYEQAYQRAEAAIEEARR